MKKDGIDLRDYFAAHAPDVPDSFTRLRNVHREVSETDLEHMIRWRYAYADAMMKARDDTV